MRMVHELDPEAAMMRRQRRLRRRVYSCKVHYAVMLIVCSANVYTQCNIR